MKVSKEQIESLVRLADESDAGVAQVVMRGEGDRAIGAVVVLDGPETGVYLDRINGANDEMERQCSAAEDAIRTHFDNFSRDMVFDAKDRGGFARLAANIAEDRYGAGSSAARVTIYILLHHGFQAAVDFAADLEHHER